MSPRAEVLADRFLLVAGTCVLILIATFSLGQQWTIRIGSIVLAWPNILRHALFGLFAAIVIGRNLLRHQNPSHRAPSGQPPFPVPSMLLFATMLAVSTLAAYRAFNTPVYALWTDHFNGWARWILEDPIRRLPKIFLPGAGWPGGHNPWTDGYFRPITSLTYVIDLIWNGAVPGNLLVNLGIYAVLATSVGIVLNKITANALAGWLAAGLFCVFPLHAQVMWSIEWRNETLCALFYILAFSWFVDFDRTGQRVKLWWSFVAVGLSVLSKEHGFSFPLLPVAYLLTHGEGDCRERLRGRTKIIAAYTGIVVAVVLYRLMVYGDIGNNNEHVWLFPMRRLVVLGSLVPSALFYPLPPRLVPPSLWRLLAVVCLSAPLALVLFSRVADRTLGFFSLAVLVAASGGSDVLEMTPVGEESRYFTLASAFFVMVVAHTLTVRESHSAKIRLAAATGIIATYAVTLRLFQNAIILGWVW